MKPVDKFDRQIYPATFKKIQSIGHILLKMGWRESSRKPNLFFREIRGLTVFADMRGTKPVPIWEAPYPLLFVERHEEAWRRRKALQEAAFELDQQDIPTRLSYFNTDEPGGLFFGPEDELSDGTCKLCSKAIDTDGLFCSEKCEKSFAQLKELRREEQEQEQKCILCGKVLEIFSKDTIRHHVSYEPEIIVNVCRSCHMKIHSRHESYPDLAPKKPPDWRAKDGWKDA